MEHSTSRIRDAIALTFASFFPLVMALLYFVVLNNPGGGTNRALIAAFGIGKLVQFLFPAAYIGWFERKKMGLPGPSLRGMGLGVLFALVVGASMSLLYFFWARHLPVVAETTPAMVNDRLKQFGRDSPMGFLLMAAYICGVHSLAEEYYWRWFVFGWMRRHLSLAVAIVLSATGFMLHHVVILGVYFPGHFWTLALPFSLCVAVGGGFWAWLYQRSGSLYAPWLSHALVDAAIMSLGYLMLRRYWP
jgi:membrane protease YdiL (CAAX protease family)